MEETPGNLKRRHASNVSYSDESEVLQEGWHHHEPSQKRTRPADDHDPSHPDKVDPNAAGWFYYGGETVGQENDDSETQSSETSTRSYRRMSLDSASDDGWHQYVDPDAAMPDAEPLYDFDDDDNMDYSEPDMKSDVDMGSSEEEDDDNDGDLDSSGEEDSDSIFKDKRQRNYYNELHNAPPDAAATKRDLAKFYKFLHLNKATKSPSTFNAPKAKSQSKKNAHPQHRPPERIDLHKAVREATRQAMGLDKNELPTDAHVPTQGQVARFSKTKNSADGPQLSKTQKLKLDVGTPNLASQWNREANRLLRKHFQAHYSTGIRVDNTELADAFKTHFKTVRENYLKGTAEQTETHIQDEADKKALRAEKTRLKTLLEQRVTAAEIYAALDPKLRKIISTIQTLPKEAMSEDEADHRSGSARYVVKKLEWRADDIDAFVGILDDLHKSTRFEANGSATRGKFPRARIRNTARPPVVTAGPSGLPSNFYDTEWVDSLPDLDRRALNMQGPLDLSFSPNILRHAARYHHIVDGSQPPLDINDPSLPPISGKSQDGWTGKRAANGKGKSTANGKGKPKGTKRAHTSTQAKR